MALADDIRILSRVKLFDGLSDEQLRLLAFGAERTRLDAGERLFREGERADTAYVVVSGSLALATDRDGERVELGRAGPGAMLGELALIAPTRRPASALAEADCELIRLDRKQFRRILEEFPDFAILLRQRLSAELQDMLRRIEALAPMFDD